MPDICRVLGLPATAVSTDRLNELDEEVARTLQRVKEPAVADVLGLLNQRISVLQESLLGQLPIPPDAPVDLSADGIGFATSTPVDPDSWIAVHLVLPEGTHLVCAGQITHCQSGPGGFSVGARLQHLDKSASRCLTRYVISNK
jgi:hypothetical protein